MQMYAGEGFSDSVDGGHVESRENGTRMHGGEGPRESGMGTPRSHAENEIFGNPYLGRLSRAMAEAQRHQRKGE